MSSFKRTLLLLDRKYIIQVQKISVTDKTQFYVCHVDDVTWEKQMIPHRVGFV